jgi:hypothetical protein
MSTEIDWWRGVMLYVLAAVAIPVLWVAAFLVQRRVVVAHVRLGFDVAFGVVVGVIVAVKEGPVQGLIAGLVVSPLMVTFSALRTAQMRHVERNTRAILDGSPGMREAYDRRTVPSRRERRAGRDGSE